MTETIICEEPEIWRDVVGYEGLYQFSNKFNVRSLDGLVNHWRGGKRLVKGRLLKQSITKDGYITVGLTKDGDTETTPIQRIVARANPEICGTWFDGCHVDHLDGNKLNNSPENLKVCTCKENNNNPITRERKSKSLKGRFINRPDQSKPVVQLSMDGEFVAEFLSAKEAARQTGINQGSISHCCNGKQHSAGGYRWLYKSDWEKLMKEAG